MISIAWLFVKSAFSRIIPFLLEHWRIILIGLMCFYAYSQKVAHERAVQELATYKQQIAESVAKQAHENEIKRIKAESAIKSTQLEHDKQIEVIKNEYSKINKLSNLTIADLRNKLRQSISDTFDLPKVDTDTERTPVEWSDSYRAITAQYEILKQACTISTSDYNALRGWADAACLQVGCE
ncbi:MAG: hypothetical protein Q8Q57_09450 [Methylotenera sp.]|nr:hypothetical protein [Methylotenera sp.]